jgi:hypothetical protein
VPATQSQCPKAQKVKLISSDFADFIAGSLPKLPENRNPPGKLLNN